MGQYIMLFQAKIFIHSFENNPRGTSEYFPWIKYVDDVFAIIHNFESLTTVNKCFPSIKLTNEGKINNKLFFWGVNIIKKTPGGLEFGICRKDTSN